MRLVGRYGGRNHVRNIWWLSVKGCGCGERGKFAFSHWLDASPLQPCDGDILYRLRHYSHLLVENREIFIPHLYIAPPQGWPRLNFVNIFNAGKTRVIGLPYGEKNYDDYVKPFSSDTGTLRTDGRTDLL